MDKFAPVLNSKWYEDLSSSSTVIGSLPGDNNYTIEVPSELRPLIIELQNALYTKYQEYKEEKRKYEDSSNWFKSGGLI